MAESKKILIVDDDEEMGDTLRDILTLEGFQVEWVGNGTAALKVIGTNSVDVMLLDLLLPGMNGLDVLKESLRMKPSTMILMMSGHGTIQTAIEATRIGAFDWLEKPLEKERVLLTLRNALDKRTLLLDKEILLSEIMVHYKMVGTSAPIKSIYKLIDKVASKNISVLITGESGTGKEMVARAIHLNSKRAAKPFICVNCAAVPETLIESELFGHAKGAFTGATSAKEGKFQAANGGTLFLDEIGDLSPNAQAKILRAIETGEVESVGKIKVDKADVRIISATNKNLVELMKKNIFREDLYHRINVIEINIPPLRERPEDILQLADYFISIICSQNNVPHKKLTHDAEAVLLSYPWPGNVRELRNLIEKMIVLIESREVHGYHISELLKMPYGIADLKEEKTFQEAKISFEKNFLTHALTKNKWNVTNTAQKLKMTRSSLYEKISRYGIDVESLKPDG